MSKKIQKSVISVLCVMFFHPLVALPFGASSGTPQVGVITPIEQATDLQQSIIGEVIAKNRVELVSRVTGFLDAKMMKDGSYVKQGEMIYQIQSQQYEAELESAKANLDKAKLNEENQQLSLSRQARLLKSNATSQESYDTAKVNADIAKTETLAAKANYDLAQLNLSYTRIIAPFTGKLGIARYSQGAFIPANATLNTLIQLDPIEVKFHPSANLYLNNAGDTVTFSAVKVRLKLANGQVYPTAGQIIYRDNEIDNATDTITIKAEFENSAYLLLPGQTVTVELERAQTQSGLLIPQKALNFAGDQVFVYLLDPAGKVQKQVITTGSTKGDNIIVTSGLSRENKVIVSGLENIREGQKVDIVSSTVSKE